ncbi:MAG: two-component regulator propeller domain-containing protein [Hoylesella buccalis]
MTNSTVATNSCIYAYNTKLNQISKLDSSIYKDFITSSDGIMPMTFDHAGRLWIGRNGKGVMALDVKTGKTRVYEANQLSDGTVRVITEDHKHNIWLGTEQGVTIIGQDEEYQNAETTIWQYQSVVRQCYLFHPVRLQP